MGITYIGTRVVSELAPTWGKLSTSDGMYYPPFTVVAIIYMAHVD